MKKFTLCIFMLCAFTISMIAQQTVTGTVLDENSEPLIGVTVPDTVRCATIEMAKAQSMKIHNVNFFIQ